MTLGASFWYLGDAKTAAEQFEKARALYTRHRGPDDPTRSGASSSLAVGYSALGRYAEAPERSSEDVCRPRKAKLGPRHPEVARQP